MKLTVLGRFGPYPDRGDTACSSYILRDEGVTLVMDMGPGTLTRLLDETDIRDITAVWISHLHYDHTSDLLPFRYLLEDLHHSVNIYTKHEDTEYYKLLFGHPDFNVINVGAGDTVGLGGAKMKFYTMKHTVPDLALRFEGSRTLVYTGDTMYCPGIDEALDGADCALMDCSKPAGFTGPHMTAPQALRIADEKGVRILATHLSPGYDPSGDFAGNKNITVVNERTTYEI